MIIYIIIDDFYFFARLVIGFCLEESDFVSIFAEILCFPKAVEL
jgi:hypothetical protein